MTEGMPDQLYVYRVYCGGTVVRLLSEHHTLEEFWAAVLEARRGDDSALWCWCSPDPSGHYARFCLDASAVVGVQDNDGAIQQPNVKEQRRRAEKERRDRQPGLVGGRVLLGQQARKHAGPKKR